EVVAFALDGLGGAPDVGDGLVGRVVDGDREGGEVAVRAGALLPIGVVDGAGLEGGEAHADGGGSDAQQDRGVGPLAGGHAAGSGHEVVDVAAAAVAHLGDRVAGLDEPAEHGLVADDAGVVRRVGGDRHVRGQSVQVGRATDSHDLAAAGEVGGDGDRVDGLP